ncbi:class I SAM-dependent methyltransferase [Bizionia sediminis]|uniref:Class I SAM-dependent methyltransferase n=1 Tax=Bizionia sediminis TaxID=1737064 RepID=A0ABW5KVV7_9FLAO
MKEFWNSRYQNAAFAYGTTPNTFFKDTLETLQLSGSILLPAEGEGRNAVYAAKLGLDVVAFDISDAGQKKALALANTERVKINYQVGTLDDLNLKPASFDALALIYAHFPADIKNSLHRQLATLVKPNGYIILEGFAVTNLELREKNPEVGGPGDKNMLFTTEEMAQLFSDFDIIQLEEQEVTLQEGLYHNGQARVIRFVGKKRA